MQMSSVFLKKPNPIPTIKIEVESKEQQPSFHASTDAKGGARWAVFLIALGDGHCLEHTFNGDEAVKALAIGPRCATSKEVIVTTPGLGFDVVQYGLVGEAVVKIKRMIPYFLI
jgi:hypothetical protein